MHILGIETSCDETSAALVEVQRGFRFNVLSNVVASQMKIHAKYGGVVPEVAARSHITAILPVIQKALKPRGLAPKSLKPNLIAVTAGPGLISALSVGLETARYLGYAWGVPVVATNHLAGHLYSSLLNIRGSTSIGRSNLLALSFPALGLIVSGGHTELVLMKAHGHYKLIGETLDDAAGEAFDKIAKLLGLPYPGGPQLAKLAEKGNPHAYDFPRGMVHSGDYNFSFSGLKTSVLYFFQKIKKGDSRFTIYDSRLADICASVQAAIVDVLVTKTVLAAKKYRAKTVLLGGGVSANKRLRAQLGKSLREALPSITYNLSPITYTTDNAAMIAAAGYITYKKHGASRLDRLTVDPHLPL